MDPKGWPGEFPALERLQMKLSSAEPDTWAPPRVAAIGGCFVCFGRGGYGRGGPGDPGWAAAAVIVERRLRDRAEVEGEAGAAYAPGLLAAREGTLLEKAVNALPAAPEVLLVNATGLDHPRRAGLALHLGWVTDLPTVGVTHRPLLASGDEPAEHTGAASPLRIGEEQVGWLLRTRAGALPLAVSPGWRTNLEIAREVVLESAWRVRTPEPIRQARRLARTARSHSNG